MKAINRLLHMSSRGFLIVLAVITITACSAPSPSVPSSDNPATGTPLSPSKNVDEMFVVDFENDQNVSSGSTIKIPLNIKGATAAAGNGIAGYHITLTNLPAYVSKAVLTVDGNFWPVNSSELANGSITFYGENAEKVLTLDKAGFFVLELTIGTITQSGSFTIAIDLADNAIPSGSHSVTGPNGLAITLNPR